MKSYITLINDTLALGLSVSVWDGEAWQVKRSNDKAAIIAAVKSVGEAQLRIRDSEGNIKGWALVSADIGFEDDETVMDYSDNEFMNQLAA